MLLSFLDAVCSHNVSEMKNNDFIDTLILNDKGNCHAIIELTKVNENL